MIVHPGCVLFLFCTLSCSAALAQELSLGESIAHASIMAEYRHRRDTAADSLEGQLELAGWCREQGLELQEIAHLRRALRFSPDNRQIHEALGNVNVNGQWLTQEQLLNQQKRMAAAESRMERWQSTVRECLRMIRSKDIEKREQGWAIVEAIDDPSIITVAESILLPVNSAVALRTLDMIDRFEVREASEILARTALADARTPVRERALCLLADRNPHDYVPLLLGEMETPVKADYSVRPVGQGNVNYQFTLFRQNMESDSVIQFDQDLIQESRSPSLQNQSVLAGNASARARMAMNLVDEQNDAIRSRNRRIQDVLEYATGELPGRRPEDWWNWWYQQNEIQTLWRPANYTQVEVEDIVLQDPRPEMTLWRSMSGREISGMRLTSPGRSAECLVAGTKIWTDRGPVAVEQISHGDVVECWNPGKGTTELQVVLGRTERPETPTWRVLVEGDVIQASGGHYFQIEGRGWTRVRDFESGMAIVSATGKPAIVQYIEPADAQPLFNLVVNGNASYLVGTRKVVSHDASMPFPGSKTIEEFHAAKLQ